MSEGRLRVLTFISGLAIGGSSGGSEKFGLEVVRRLDRARFEPILCAFWRRRQPVEEHWRDLLLAEGITVFFAAERGPRLSLGRYAGGMRRVLRETAPGVDIIHSHYQLGSIAAMLLRRPLHARAIVRTAHGTVQHEWSRRPLARMGRRVFTCALFPFAFDCEVGVSVPATESLNARWASRIAGRPAITIPNAIPAAAPVTVDRPTKRQELGFASDDIIIGSVGRLTEQKGYIYLVRAAPRILARYPQAYIVVVGDGELRQMLEQEAVRLGVAERIRFLGVRTDVPDLYRALDLFVLPSLYEGLPTVVLEAMAYATPVVATDIPGTRDLLTDGHNGWLARPADPDDLARAVLAALQGRANWPLVTARAFDETLPQFRIEHVVQRYEALYESLCAGRTAAGDRPSRGL